MKILCAKCKGSKKVNDWAAIVFTAGLAAIFSIIDDEELRKKKCDRCNGKGYIKI